MYLNKTLEQKKIDEIKRIENLVVRRSLGQNMLVF